MLSKDIHPKILRSLDSNRILVNPDIEAIQNLACLQQKLLSLTAIKYGIYDIKTCSLANNYLCSLAFRIVVVLKLFNDARFNAFGIGKTVLKHTSYCEWVKYLSYANVLNHKVSSIKWACLSNIKGSNRGLGILKISHRLIQMLFVLVYEPIIECVSDVCSYGFRKNRHSHQAIGALFSKLDRRFEKRLVFYASKYILKYDIRKFWDFVDRNWFMDVFPAHTKHRDLIKVWLDLSADASKVKSSYPETFFFEHCVEPLFVNFVLNGLEESIQPGNIEYLSDSKRRWLVKKKSLVREKVVKNCWIIIENFAVRYCNDFIIITNCKTEVSKIRLKVWKFLSVRGLKMKIYNDIVFKLNMGQTFYFLGFTFKFVRLPKLMQRTKKMNKRGSIKKPRTVLFVYASNRSIQNLKNKINLELKFISRPVSQLITKLNFIIKKWAHYFAIGHRGIFSNVDGYIFQRCFKFISKKFPQMPKTLAALTFFCYKRRTIHWNFNASSMFTKKNIQIVLVRIRSLVKFIPVFKLRPYCKELLNPFVYFQKKKSWFERITRVRYKVS
jgi:Group II intron, maturase-specific domain